MLLIALLLFKVFTRALAYVLGTDASCLLYVVSMPSKASKYLLFVVSTAKHVSTCFATSASLLLALLLLWSRQKVGTAKVVNPSLCLPTLLMVLLGA